MATTDRTSANAPAVALAERLRAASFAHFLVRSDGASLAAAGLLATACVATDTPYQVSAVRTRRDVDARTEVATEATTVVRIGVPSANRREAPDDPTASDEDVLIERPSLTAFEAAEELGAEPDPALALAGVVAGGEAPEDVAPTVLEHAGIERRPGLAAPVADPTDALAHTSLAHAPYSGDSEAVAELVASVDADDADRRLASLLAIDAVSAEGATERAAEAIERSICPLAGGPLETVEGYADVLDALAASAPGRAVSLALGGAPDASLDAWRTHAVAAHEAVRSADVERRDGFLVARSDGPPEAVARLLRDFRSSVPVVLAIGRTSDETEGEEAADGDAVGSIAEAALATIDASAEAIETAAEAVDGSGLARGTTGYARFDVEREEEFLAEIEGAI